MYYRRKVLLSLIEKSPDRTLGKLNLQKILFLFSQKQKDHFQFVPYHYGCFSFQANKDLSVLAEHYNLVAEDSKSWKLPEHSNYFSALKKEDQLIITQLLDTFDVTNENELISHTYENYPYFSINSKRNMTTKQIKLVDIEKSKLASLNQKILFSIGYEGKSIDTYLNLLLENNIKLLCDVRRNPLSMKYGFSKLQLSSLCSNVGITYIHIPELGIASENRNSLNDMSDYTKLFAIYSNELPELEKHVNKVIKLLNEFSRIALTCFESTHTCCHRGTLIEYITQVSTINKVKHL